MEKVGDFCSVLKENGFNFFVGVPCSIFKETINYLISDSNVTYIGATREDEAIGIATGAYLAGQNPVVIMQNSGLGNTIGAITSLVLLYKIPILFLISWRGYKGEDAPEHHMMGEVTTQLLKDMQISTTILEKEGVEKAISSIKEAMKKDHTPSAIIVRRGIIQ